MGGLDEHDAQHSGLQKFEGDLPYTRQGTHICFYATLLVHGGLGVNEEHVHGTPLLEL